ncbi:MAG: phosphoserine phosphatase SerB, partial [Rhodobacteraceae bacterium]|nr:phosphoserine phosphatase SerB [Paracoccaceae bacterium]
LDSVAPRRLSACAVDVVLRGARPAVVLAGVDVNFVPALNREKKLLIADMDSTIIPVECIDELADFAGVKAEISEITEVAMRGEMGFEESLEARVALLAGLGEGALECAYEERISINPGACALVETMNVRGAYTALVSGGFTYFTGKVAAKVGFQHNRANVLNMAGGVLDGTVTKPILGRESKLEAMDELCAARGITRADVIAVGDGANDLAMIEGAGLGVAYHAKAALKAKADVVLDHSDLSALLALQGL